MSTQNEEILIHVILASIQNVEIIFFSTFCIDIANIHLYPHGGISIFSEPMNSGKEETTLNVNEFEIQLNNYLIYQCKMEKLLHFMSTSMQNVDIFYICASIKTKC